MKGLILIVFLLITHPNDFTLLDSVYDLTYLDNYYRAVSLVPDNMMKCIEVDGWKVKIINNLEEYDAHANGLCIPDKKLLLVDPVKCIRDGYSVEYVIIHELSHAFDHQKDMPSSMIYNTGDEKNQEVFANALAKYLMGYELPKYHEDFIKDILKN